VLWYKRLEAGVFKLPRMTLVLLLFLGKPGALPPTEVILAHKAGAAFAKVFPCAQPFPASCPSKSTMAHRRLRKQVPRDSSVAMHMQEVC
jgi:hypothetical protein